MSTGLKQPCPCGSGKRYKHCCLNRDRKRNRNGFSIALAVVAVLATVTIYAVSARERASRTRLPLSSPGSTSQRLPSPPGTAAATSNGATVRATAKQGGIPVTSPDQSPLPGGVTPKPWQYDAPRNRHWDPTHKHWHTGPPPQGVSTPATAGAQPAGNALAPQPGGSPSPKSPDPTGSERPEKTP